MRICHSGIIAYSFFSTSIYELILKKKLLRMLTLWRHIFFLSWSMTSEGIDRQKRSHFFIYRDSLLYFQPFWSYFNLICLNSILWKLKHNLDLHSYGQPFLHVYSIDLSYRITLFSLFICFFSSLDSYHYISN